MFLLFLLIFSLTIIFPFLQIDKYLYSPEDPIKSGALLACGIVNCGVRNECDPALALLSDYVGHESQVK